VAALLGLVYSFLVLLPLFLWVALDTLAHIDTTGPSAAPVYTLSVLGVVLPSLFTFGQIKREYRRAAKAALKG